MDVAKFDLRSGVPPEVAAVVDRLLLRGSAWLVGGTVRDLLLDTPPRDYDVATTLLPAQVADLLPGADLRDARFGTCRVHAGDRVVSITTLRRDGDYRDHRHPDGVEFVTELAIDARRRDFTCNALYVDLPRGEVLDPVGGLADLRQGILRCIGDPLARFEQDALRLLRAVRFSARCALQLDPATAAAVRAAAGRLRELSPERVFAELTDAFTSPGRGRALELLVDLGLAEVLLPEVAAMRGVTQPPEYHPEGCVLTHVALVLGHVPAGDPVLAWSAVLHDVGKPPTWRLAEDRIRFDGHDVLSAAMAERILERLHAPTSLREVVVEICRDHIRFAALPGMRPRRAEAWLRSPHFPQHLEFHRADCLGSHGKLDLFHFAGRLLASLPPVSPPLVVGKDVLDLGVAPGPAVGELLRSVHAAADEAPVPMDRGAALILLRDTVAHWRQDGRLPAR
jgi:poly(A) polymerase